VSIYFSTDNFSNQIVYSIPSGLPRGEYLLTLDSSIIKNTSGKFLDGEPLNFENLETPSGDGLQGGDFFYTFYVETHGEVHFTDYATSCGVDLPAFSCGVAWGDFDQDGFSDLYVTNFGGSNEFFSSMYQDDPSSSLFLCLLVAKFNLFFYTTKARESALSQIPLFGDRSRVSDLISEITYINYRR
jgi:hypothetical protein